MWTAIGAFLLVGVLKCQYTGGVKNAQQYLVTGLTASESYPDIKQITEYGYYRLSTLTLSNPIDKKNLTEIERRAGKNESMNAILQDPALKKSFVEYIKEVYRRAKTIELTLNKGNGASVKVPLFTTRLKPNSKTYVQDCNALLDKFVLALKYNPTLKCLVVDFREIENGRYLKFPLDNYRHRGMFDNPADKKEY
ncbi:MAG: hypothetical protein QE263_00190 [Vampirovibrionales bacterium]|nr:hypothetical protein [Vampirovibrionales bacterium]